MAIKKVTTYDYEIIGDWSINVRRRDSYVENDVELSVSFNRHVVHPSDDWSSEPAEVQSFADAFFTDNVKTAWKAHLKAIEDSIPKGGADL